MLSREELDAMRDRAQRWLMPDVGSRDLKRDVERLLETVETFARALAGYQGQPMRSRDVDSRCQFCGAIWHYYLNEDGRMREESTGHAASCPVVQARALGY